jgi:hypothetical protein
LQEIRDAITGPDVDRVVLIVGPGALDSEYVRYEWQHALQCGKPVVPLLRIGDYAAVGTLLPEQLKAFQCVDFTPARPRAASVTSRRGRPGVER